MKRERRWALGVGAGLLTTLAALAAPPAQTAFFESQVRPVLLESCVACHGAGKPQGNLRLDAPLTPSDAQKVLAAIRYDGPVKMPPGEKLSAPKIAALDAWVKAGAPWPKTPPGTRLRVLGARGQSWFFTSRTRSTAAGAPARATRS